MIPELHKPADHRFVDVAEDEGSVAGYVGWSVEPLRERGTINLLAVTPAFRGGHIGRELCEHAIRGMKALGAKIVEIGTGGDPLHAPAGALYESLGCTLIPWRSTSGNSRPVVEGLRRAE